MALINNPAVGNTVNGNMGLPSTGTYPTAQTSNTPIDFSSISNGGSGLGQLISTLGGIGSGIVGATAGTQAAQNFQAQGQNAINAQNAYLGTATGYGNSSIANTQNQQATSAGYNNAAVGAQNNLLNQAVGYLKPGTTEASTAGNALNSIFNPAQGQAPNYSAFNNNPGYQFATQQGQNAINRQAAASGNLYSTNTLANLSQYNTGMASQNYNNYVGQLMSMAGLGNQAATSAAGSAITTGANQGTAYNTASQNAIQAAGLQNQAYLNQSANTYGTGQSVGDIYQNIGQYNASGTAANFGSLGQSLSPTGGITQGINSLLGNAQNGTGILGALNGTGGLGLNGIGNTANSANTTLGNQLAANGGYGANDNLINGDINSSLASNGLTGMYPGSGSDLVNQTIDQGAGGMLSSDFSGDQSLGGILGDGGTDWSNFSGASGQAANLGADTGGVGNVSTEISGSGGYDSAGNAFSSGGQGTGSLLGSASQALGGLGDINGIAGAVQNPDNPVGDVGAASDAYKLYNLASSLGSSAASTAGVGLADAAGSGLADAGLTAADLGISDTVASGISDAALSSAASASTAALGGGALSGILGAASAIAPYAAPLAMVGDLLWNALKPAHTEDEITSENNPGDSTIKLQSGNSALLNTQTGQGGVAYGAGSSRGQGSAQWFLDPAMTGTIDFNSANGSQNYSATNGDPTATKGSPFWVGKEGSQELTQFADSVPMNGSTPNFNSYLQAYQANPNSGTGLEGVYNDNGGQSMWGENYGQWLQSIWDAKEGITGNLET